MNNILIVVDMQNDFVSGSLGTPEAKAITEKVAKKIKTHEGKIIFTYDTHQMNYDETQEGKNLPVPHCIQGTKGWELAPEIEALRKETESSKLGITFKKPTFGSKKLGDYLLVENEKEPIDSIELVGLCTDVCVISNALLLKAYLPEIPITVDSNCCAGVTPESHENALNAMRSCQIKII